MRNNLGQFIKGHKVLPNWSKAIKSGNKSGHHRVEHTEESKKKMSLNARWKGLHSWNWLEDRTKALEKHRIRSCRQWIEWRKKVFERDNYTCQECGASRVLLEPHHIIPIRSNGDTIYKETNGITLCRPCHRKTVWKESNFFEKYSQLVVAQNN